MAMLTSPVASRAKGSPMQTSVSVEVSVAISGQTIGGAAPALHPSVNIILSIPSSSDAAFAENSITS